MYYVRIYKKNWFYFNKNKPTRGQIWQPIDWDLKKKKHTNVGSSNNHALGKHCQHYIAQRNVRFPLKPGS